MELNPETSWVNGYFATAVEMIPIIKTTLDKKDSYGTLRVRLGIGRDDYNIPLPDYMELVLRMTNLPSW